MKAVVCHDTQLEVTDVPAPEPGRGHLLLDVHHCGICGSDLHLLGGYIPFMERGDVLGHEFLGEIVEVMKEVFGVYEEPTMI